MSELKNDKSIYKQTNERTTEEINQIINHNDEIE